ncbi:MAG: hypothetical protein M3264_12880 [Thermoproteota archaeon]|nr:hypothetical protein [Thermoproteota archaeon]
MSRGERPRAEHQDIHTALEVKQRQKEEEADHLEDTQRLVTEIEMLKVVLFLVSRNERKEKVASGR